LVEKKLGHSTPTPDGKDQHPLMTFVTPGLRYYFKGANGIARYALGCNLIIGHGKGASTLYTNGTNELVQRHIAGFAITNGLYVQLSKYIRVGTELALGICSDSRLNSSAPYNDLSSESTDPFAQLTFTIGYRKCNTCVSAPKR
jgi:hypothetical protein